MKLQVGKTYYILLTTAYGLYRYNIYDVVRVHRLLQQDAAGRILEQGGATSPTSPAKSCRSITSPPRWPRCCAISNLNLTAYSLAPCWDDELPYYGLFVERGDLANRDQGILLARNWNAGWPDQHRICLQARKPTARPDAAATPGRAAAWQHWDRQRLARTGGTLEQYKHPCLIADPKFRDGITIDEEVIPQRS